jgi:hypothetical protein
MASSDDRLALIDAEILRCKGEMEKVLVGGEGMVLASRRTDVPNGARSKKPRGDEWKTILMEVGKRLNDLKPQPSVQPLYAFAKNHLDAAIKHIVSASIDRDAEWASMRVYLGNSRNFFETIAFTLRFNANKISYVFDALVSGLSSEKYEWDQQKNHEDRSAFLLGLLGKIGD